MGSSCNQKFQYSLKMYLNLRHAIQMRLFLNAGFTSLISKRSVHPRTKCFKISELWNKMGVDIYCLFVQQMPTQMTSLLAPTQLTCSQCSFFIPNIVLHTLPLFKAKLSLNPPKIGKENNIQIYTHTIHWRTLKHT